MNKRKGMATTGLLAMGLIFALATLGLVVGNWTQKLTIGGSVSTANFEVQWKGFTTTDLETDTGLKDIGTCTVTPSTANPKSVEISITKAYPNYYCIISGGVSNTGDVPVHLEDSLTVKDGSDLALAAALHIDGPTCDPDTKVLQQHSSVQCRVKITVGPDKPAAGGESSVPENAKVSLNYSVTATQWDKVTKGP